MNKAIIFIFAALVTLTSCSHQRMIERAKDTLIKDTLEAATFCHFYFPVVESIVYKPGDTVIQVVATVRDSVVQIQCPPATKDTQILTKIQFKEKQVTKVVVDTFVATQKDTAELTMLRKTIAAKDKDIAEKDSKIQQQAKFVSWFWILLSANVVGLGLFVYFKIHSGAITSIINGIKNKL